MGTEFEIGQVLEATVSAQGLIKGKQYRVTNKTIFPTPFGGFVSYAVVDAAVRRVTRATVKQAVANASFVMRAI